MLSGEIIAVCSEIQTKHINAEFFVMLNLVVYIVTIEL